MSRLSRSAALVALAKPRWCHSRARLEKWRESCLSLVLTGAVLLALAADAELGSSTSAEGVPGLTPTQVGVIINDNDPSSIEVGTYYILRRAIPPENVVRVRVPVQIELSREQLAELKRQVDARLPSAVQALAIAWTSPSRVECNSLTAALARGFEARPCETNTCGLGQPSPYFKSASNRPYDDLGVRPAMMLAGWSVGDAKMMIDRGVASDGTMPTGVAALLITSDRRRSLRALQYGS